MNKLNSLNKNEDFKIVFNNNKKKLDNNFILFYKKNDLNHFRVGLAISKKIIKTAVKRNKIKRIIKEILRKQKININYDFVIVLSKNFSTKNIDYKKIEESIISLLSKIYKDTNEKNHNQ